MHSSHKYQLVTTLEPLVAFEGGWLSQSSNSILGSKRKENLFFEGLFLGMISLGMVKVPSLKIDIKIYKKLHLRDKKVRHS